MTEPRQRSQKVVVVGQGYVGLPLAHAAVDAGYRVVGVDLDEERVRALNEGRSFVDDISDEDVTAMRARGYIASTSSAEYRDADIIVICVPTPLGRGTEPDLRAIRAATAAIASALSPDTLVILESTTYPGTTATEIAPALEAAGFVCGSNVFVAFSPERIDPGNKFYGIRNTPKVVGADDPESLQRALSFYEQFIDKVVPVSGTAEAELSKLLENTYRHINIGLVNELAIVCHELGIDVWEVIRAASTKPFGFQAFYPGPGVGGHCIPIDPNYLNYQVRQVLDRPFRFVELAQDINSAMPSYVVSRAQDLLNRQSRPVKGSNILLLGVTYKAGISDTRESPADDVAQLLLNKGAEVSFFDPRVENWLLKSSRSLVRTAEVRQAVRNAHLTILLQPIPGLDADDLASEAQLFFDTRGVTRSSGATRL
jgi:UDP-N-acetyl-D-glucosamine dehydrogenase